MWCIGPASMGTDRPVRSPVLLSRELSSMAVHKGARQCTRWATTGIKCWMESPVLTNGEMVLIVTIYRTNYQ
jgi:hypothetical protein